MKIPQPIVLIALKYLMSLKRKEISTTADPIKPITSVVSIVIVAQL